MVSSCGDNLFVVSMNTDVVPVWFTEPDEMVVCWSLVEVWVFEVKTPNEVEEDDLVGDFWVRGWFVVSLDEAYGVIDGWCRVEDR